MRFLVGLPPELREQVLQQIKIIWTHSSTALEGNTFSLGDTEFFLKEGITISGKSLIEHNEIYGHSKAIDTLLAMLDKATITPADMFALHLDVMHGNRREVPCGCWKDVDNYTLYTDPVRQWTQTYKYAPVADVPMLMEQWGKIYKDVAHKPEMSQQEAVDAYTRLHVHFVLVHPFRDGNGRMARLLSNIPLLQAGHVPVVIPKDMRKDYIDALVHISHNSGRLDKEHTAINPMFTEPLKAVCVKALEPITTLIEEARQISGTSELAPERKKCHRMR